MAALAAGRRRLHQRHAQIEIVIEGCKHRGQCTLRQGAKLCVGGFYGSQTVELSDAPTTTRAKEVLRDLVLTWQRQRAAAPPPVRRRPSPAERPTPVTVRVTGKSWSGTWRLLGGQVFVSSAYGERSAPVKRSTPVSVAERLLDRKSVV